MPIQQVVLVGHCGFDSGAIARAVAAALPGVPITSADDSTTLARVARPDALLLINRVLDYGFNTSNGVDLIRALREQADAPRCVLISNYPDAQQAAEDAGALPGFGKNDLGRAAATQRLKAAAE